MASADHQKAADLGAMDSEDEASTPSYQLIFPATATASTPHYALDHHCRASILTLVRAQQHSFFISDQTDMNHSADGGGSSNHINLYLLQTAPNNSKIEQGPGSTASRNHRIDGNATAVFGSVLDSENNIAGATSLPPLIENPQPETNRSQLVPLPQQAALPQDRSEDLLARTSEINTPPETIETGGDEDMATKPPNEDDSPDHKCTLEIEPGAVPRYRTISDNNLLYPGKLIHISESSSDGALQGGSLIILTISKSGFPQCLMLCRHHGQEGDYKTERDFWEAHSFVYSEREYLKGAYESGKPNPPIRIKTSVGITVSEDCFVNYQHTWTLRKEGIKAAPAGRVDDDDLQKLRERYWEVQKGMHSASS